MTFKFDRYDIEPIDFGTNGTMRTNRDDGEYVLADDAINREAVNEAKIRTLEVQLKDAIAALASNKAAAVAVGEPKPVARITGADEYGPLLVWSTHWVELIGKNLYLQPAAAQPSRAEVLEEAATVADGFACGTCGMDGKCAAAIRALKDKQ